MANYPVQGQGLKQGLWDIPRMVRGNDGQGRYLVGGAAASYKLAPTALAPAVWAVAAVGVSYAYIWSIWFATDTALWWYLYINTGNPGLTIEGKGIIGNGGTGNNQFQAEVTAAPGGSTLIKQGYAVAGFSGEILAPSWVQNSQGSVVLMTDEVAANCAASFWWGEMAE